MTRPQIIRADTIDLQDHHAPSAKDHTKQPTHPAALGAGPPAPHQAETLREVAIEAEDEQRRSPRVSDDWNNGEFDNHTEVSSSLNGVNLQQQDALAIAQNGGLTGAEDADMADAEGDDGLDDDMMDKISSSPSIDDGGYSIPQIWPKRFDSLSVAAASRSSYFLSRDWTSGFSSPFVELANSYPLSSIAQQASQEILGSEHHATPFPHECRGSGGNSSGDADSMYEDEGRDVLGPLPNDMMDDVVESYDEGLELCSADELFVVQADFDPSGSYDEGFDPAIMTIPYESSEDEDNDDIQFPEDSRFVDSGWGGECLQESEDIDFDLVYALHTFVATVEGQANATKGDTMVLLDDSNSYWWLVRVVKDSSIGYLPAEHIETPTERLARLNKHRNIDLSATMLGDKDQAEKSKNPLKKAIRRRNAKTVTFSAPTYVEASDIDYSTEEEDGEGEYYGQEQQQQDTSQQAEREDDEITLVEAPATGSDVRHVEAETTNDASRGSDDKTSKSSSEAARVSEETFDGKQEAIGKSRNGVVRNTDSFFKDDSVETRKITLTPNLLRDDSSTSTRTSNDSKEARQRPSLDKVEKDAVSDKSKEDKKKKDKKDKDKKPGMLSNLFKRKDKKGKLQEEDIDDIVYGKKASSEDPRASPAPSKDSEDYQLDEQSHLQTSPQRQPSKLQKQPRIEGGPAKQLNISSEPRSAEPQRRPTFERPPPAVSSNEPSMRLVRPDNQDADDSMKKHQVTSSELNRAAQPQDQGNSQSAGAASQRVYSSTNISSGSKPETVKQATVRSELDDFDSSEESSPVEERAKEPARQAPKRPIIPGAYPDSHNVTPVQEKTDLMNERLSESPVQVSLTDVSRSNPPALMVDTSSQEEAASPISSPSPDLVDVDELNGKKSSEISVSTPTSSSTWNDAHLRTFFDDDTDIKDLLLVVYDKSGVVPAGPDHPVTGNMFKEENAKLADITNRLDNMLGDWLARKMKTAASR